MHIILTSNFSPWSTYSGGGQRSTHNLATALANRGHRVDVIYTKTVFENISLPLSISYNLHWALLPSLKSKRASWLRNFTIFSVRKKVSTLLSNQTIIHSNGEEGALLPSLKKNGAIPFILTPRYPRIPDTIQNPSASTLRCLLHINNTKFHLLGKVLKEADVCSPTSRFTLNMLQEHYDLGEAKKTVIPNGVDKIFLDAKPKDKFSGNLIFFGRLAHSKGIDTLLEALSIINNPELKLLIIGRGELEQKLKSRAKNLSIQNQVTFKPWMSQPELVNALEESSLAVLPSREESFGNTMAEAMATATPVISTTAGSVPEVVINKKTGLLVPPSDPNALGKAIESLMNDHSQAQSLADNARARVQQYFTWDAVAEAYEKEYETFLQ